MGGGRRGIGKYIIELGEDANMVQVISVTQSGNAYIDSSVYVGYLEQLNSDYINKHFSKLLQDAHDTGYKEGYAKKVEVMFDGEYQRGFEDGKKEAESSEAIEQVKMDAFNKGMLFKEEKIHDAFLRGIEKGKAVKGCEECKYECENKTKIPCILCSNNFKVPCILCANKFKNQWTAKSPIDDGFVRGDVVVDERDGTRGIVVSSENKESNLLYVLFNEYRVPQSVVRKYYKKTGEHCDIDKFLDEIKGEDDK